jgi:amino acid adenylation domain-containing protein
MLLHEAFIRSAQRSPAKEAIVDGARRITYAELLRKVLTLAHVLRDEGVEPGDRVVIFLESSLEYAVAVHAVLAAGGVCVPVSAMTKEDKLAFILGEAGARVLLTHTLLDVAWVPALARAGTPTACIATGVRTRDFAIPVRDWPVEQESPGTIDTPCTDQDLAMLIYTSGSTGSPKGVMLTHLNVTSAWASVQAFLGLRQNDVVGLVLPPVFSYGLINLLMALGEGATVVIERAAAFPEKVARTLERERVTVFPGVPTLFSALLALTDMRRFDLSAMRLVTNAAAHLSSDRVDRLRALLPGAQLLSMYGLTECVRVTFLPPDEIDRRRGSVGRGMPNQEHWLIDENGRRLPHGATGQLVVRGDHVMRGYWRRPADTAERLKLVEGAGEPVLHTGDLFRTDADGFLYFVSRMDDIIKTRGEKVAPKEIENAIYEMEGVVDCAVVGVADESLGEAIKAYVTVRPGTTLRASDIIRHCLARLENHMAPKFVEFVSALPRTESGKIRHASLRR